MIRSNADVVDVDVREICAVVLFGTGSKAMAFEVPAEERSVT